MKATCDGAYRDHAWKCAVEMVIHLCFCHLGARTCHCTYCVHKHDIYQSFAIYCHIPFPPVTFSLAHFLCHFATTANILLARAAGCCCWVYLALGSIRLQAEASHSSQSHKMWLVLTTALQGDGLIGLIALDRLGWTLYRKTTATACRGLVLAIFYLFFCAFFFFFVHHALFAFFSLLSLSVHPTPPACFLLSYSLSLPVFMFSCLHCLSPSLNFISIFFVCFISEPDKLVCTQITQQQSNLNASFVSLTFFLSGKVIFKCKN